MINLFALNFVGKENVCVCEMASGKLQTDITHYIHIVWTNALFLRKKKIRRIYILIAHINRTIYKIAWCHTYVCKTWMQQKSVFHWTRTVVARIPSKIRFIWPFSLHFTNCNFIYPSVFFGLCCGLSLFGRKDLVKEEEWMKSVLLWIRHSNSFHRCFFSA